ncbi:MAG TPA: ATP-grasp domain-containing protein [Candidatus Methylomirabilis sp.]|nr:ATP-grasp domain-containing protein [Candidatus Methylomirabilis sp.]
MRILIIGVTTRAVAESALRAGCDIVTVDYFGDLDQKRLCENHSLRERGLKYSVAALLRAAHNLRYDAVAYSGGLENHPATVARLARSKLLLGNTPDTLRRVRDPARLFPFLAAVGFAVPRTIAYGEPLPSWGTWLRKPVRGGGGQSVCFWRGQPLAAGQILQEYIEGTPASASFVADGRRSVLLGWTEQLRAPRGFSYGGNMLPLLGPPTALAEVGAIADALTAEFGLRGLNGFDFILRDNRPVLLEVNPRYCASMELFDRASGFSAFGLHLAACEGRLPERVSLRGGSWGKAIVYAPGQVTLGETESWIERGVRDVPHAGEVIEKGQPICTVLAWGATHAACAAALRAEMEAIWSDCPLLACAR